MKYMMEVKIIGMMEHVENETFSAEKWKKDFTLFFLKKFHVCHVMVLQAC